MQGVVNYILPVEAFVNGIMILIGENCPKSFDQPPTGDAAFFLFVLIL